MHMVQLSKFGSLHRETTFQTRRDADECVRLLREVMPVEFSTHIEKVVPNLNGWRPDQADKLALRELVAINTVPAIKFARMKAGSGLNEAKYWVYEHFTPATL